MIEPGYYRPSLLLRHGDRYSLILDAMRCSWSPSLQVVALEVSIDVIAPSETMIFSCCRLS
jgi:hypothetical protein